MSSQNTIVPDLEGEYIQFRQTSHMRVATYEE